MVKLIVQREALNRQEKEERRRRRKKKLALETDLKSSNTARQSRGESIIRKRPIAYSGQETHTPHSSIVFS